MSFVDERRSSSPDQSRNESSRKPRSIKPRSISSFAPVVALKRRRRMIADRWLDREHRRRRWKWAVAGLMLALIAAGVWVVWFSPWLAVDKVRVVGLSPESEFTGAGQAEQTAAISLGTPLALVDTDTSGERVGQLPWIESVEVYRSWPSQVVIEVVERTPVAVVQQGDARRGVDVSGVVFDPPGGLWLTDPVIQGDEAAVPEAVAVVSSLPEEIERRVRVVQAVSPDDIRLQLGNDAIVRWGNAEDGDFKAQVLLALLPRRAQAYDVSAPQLPTTFGEKGPR